MRSFFAIVSLLAVLGVESAKVATPTCGGSTSSKDIQLTNPTNPPRQCEYHINAYSKYVCQLRIDFAMTLAQPSLHDTGSGQKTSECTQDYFEVNGLRLCGVEVWQHIYVPFNTSAGASTVDLNIILANRAGGFSLPTPEWNMLVTQLECPVGGAVRSLPQMEGRATTFSDGFFVAPPGCLQYFPQSKGVVKSFNYNEGNGIYPSGLNYAICFRRDTSTKELNIRSYFFNVGGDRQASTLQTDSSCYGTGSSAYELADYLMVPQATLVDSSRPATYFCGAINQDVVITSNNPGPLVVLFNSGEIYEHDAGFAFTYTVK